MSEVPQLAAPGASEPPLTIVERATWIMAILAAWLVMHLYAGIGHDAILYTMQALGHLRPDLWAQDIYLRFGSQDRYTLFTPLYAGLMRFLGTEHAAQVLTIAAQLAFVSAAWRLSRRLLSERLAFAGLLLLVALPGSYGAGDIFRLVEDFVTPRLLAEALVLAAIACWIRARRRWATILTLIALLVHPLMGVTAVVFLLWLEVALPRPRLALMLAAVGLAILLAIGLAANGPPLRFDAAWYSWVPENMPHLQIKHWRAGDWGVALAPMLVLCAGIAVLGAPARALAQSGLGIALAGIAVTTIGADQLHLVLLTQAQPWRCLWLSTTLATLLAPAIAQLLWRHSLLGRAAALLMLAQFVLMHEFYAPLLALLALAVLLLAVRFAPRIAPQYQRLAFLGALLICVLALLVASANYYVAAHYRYFPNQVFAGPVWLKSLREGGSNGLAALLLLALLLLCTTRPWRRSATLAALLMATAACGALAPLAFGLWTRTTYQDADKAMFASWRKQIPVGSEVLFTENPLFVWIFLERPSYISRAELLSALFSRPAALVLTEREAALRPYLRAQGLRFWDPDPMAPAGVPTLAQACAAPGLEFVASRVPLQATPIATVPADVSVDFRGLKLYRCSTGGSQG